MILILKSGVSAKMLTYLAKHTILYLIAIATYMGKSVIIFFTKKSQEKKKKYYVTFNPLFRNGH